MTQERTSLLQQAGAGPVRPLGFVLVLALFFSVPVLLPAAGHCEAPEFSEESQECFDCHDDEGLEKDLASGEVLALNIAPSLYAASAHGDLDCTDCHESISTDDHPEERGIAGLGEYRREQSAMCGGCHDEERDSESSMHRYLAAGYAQLPCTECHKPHTAPALAAWKSELGVNGYCLECHTRELKLTLGNGELQSLAMNPDDLGQSVHLSHDCSDCHVQFSREHHPDRNFSSMRQHSIALADDCSECHASVSEKYEDSLHHTLLDEGNLSVPVCTDCHGFHTVQEAETMAQLSGLPCRKCHLEIFNDFTLSSHGSSEKTGHFSTPLCADCHQSHAIRPAFWTRQVRSACVSCHGDVTPEHQAWLPNTGLHLEGVACPACHAPAAVRGVDLVLERSVDGSAFSREELEKITGGEDWSVRQMDGVALWRMLRRARQIDGGGETALAGRLMIRTGADAHRLSGKNGALRDCDTCHDPGAAAFDSLTVTIMTEDGRPYRIQARSDVLGSITSVDSLRGFYMLGGTRIKLLDILLILSILGGMSVPALHMTARILASKKRGETAS